MSFEVLIIYIRRLKNNAQVFFTAQVYLNFGCSVWCSSRLKGRIQILYVWAALFGNDGFGSGQSDFLEGIHTFFNSLFWIQICTKSPLKLLSFHKNICTVGSTTQMYKCSQTKPYRQHFGF